MKKLDLSYKNHIQSLRALSVLLVFFYHLNFYYFSKGYLGVDIFFVISGFVITQRIYKDLEIHNKIYLINFYIRRVKRIVPNLIFIVSITYLIYLFFGPPNISLWKDTISAIFGISNLFFLYSNQDYFYNIQNNPLAHTWSLGVEEQFYLIFPFIIYIVFKFFNKKDYVQKELRKLNIEANQVHFRNDKYSIFKKFINNSKFKNMQNLENKYLVLPCHTNMTLSQAKFITKSVNQITN